MLKLTYNKALTLLTTTYKRTKVGVNDERPEKVSGEVECVAEHVVESAPVTVSSRCCYRLKTEACTT